MRSTRWMSLGLLLVVALLAAAFVTGCPRAQAPTDGEEEGEATVNITPYVAAWERSLHAVPVTFAAEEEDCVRCHDGGAFAQAVTNPREIKRPTPFGPWVVATDCRACHTGQGERLLQSQEVTIPSSTQTIRAGKGALCMKCHNERRPPDIKDATRAYPHYGAEGAVLAATGGMRLAGFNLLTTRRHQTIANACVYCHMSKSGGASHDFKPETRTCTRCHKGLTNIETYRARADYDGNGRREAFVQEVDGLMSAVASATLARSGDTTFTPFQGDIVFKSGNTTTPPSRIDDISYLGAYNVVLIRHDKSEGIHNPAFTVTLLQETYRTVTGRALPNAVRPTTRDRAPRGVIQSGVTTGTP